MSSKRPLRKRRGTPVTGPDGTEYASHAAAARALGVHHSTIDWHIRTFGDLNLVGMLYVPVVWRRRKYPSLTAVAKASGTTPQTVCYHLNRYGNLDRLGMGRKGAPGNKSQARPVTIGPCQWPSRTALAADLGVSRSTVRNWLSGRGPAGVQDRLMAAAMARTEPNQRKAA